MHFCAAARTSVLGLCFFMGVWVMSRPAAAAVLQLEALAWTQTSSGISVDDRDYFAGVASNGRVIAIAPTGLNRVVSEAWARDGAVGAKVHSVSALAAADGHAFALSTSKVTLNPPPSYAGSEYGIVTAQISFTGSVSAFGSGGFTAHTASIDAKIQVPGIELVKGQYLQDGQFIGEEFGTYPFTYIVKIGDPTDYTTSASAYAYAYAWDGGHADVRADFGSTVRWMGVTGVTQEDGTPIIGYTLTDQDGTDWTQPLPVPEPSSVLTLLALMPLLHRNRLHAR
jgi:hypothetical protein